MAFEESEPTTARTSAELPTTSVEPRAAAPGSVIGPYELLELIGEGGMGQVWLAQQNQPVRRRIAIKLIKVGMDTREVVARFASERQSLALMDHPAIAKVYDAGSTAEGRPYFVMEFVDGLPITAYCDRHKLTVRERLDLFIQVCEGVQHAHQKAIIHRDLKPSNILAGAERRNDIHASRIDDRDLRLHEPGAGQLGGRGYRHPQRCLLHGCGAL